MTILNSPDTIRGNAGIATANIKGNIKDLFYLSKFEMTATIDNHEVITVGNIMKGNKKGLISIAGTIEIYDVTSDFMVILEDYKRTQKYTYFSITGTTNDPDSNAGIKRIRYDRVSFNELPLQLIDTGTDVIKASFAVVADDFTILERHKL